MIAAPVTVAVRYKYHRRGFGVGGSGLGVAAGVGFFTRQVYRSLNGRAKSFAGFP